jgi:hypothetical protein
MATDLPNVPELITPVINNGSIDYSVAVLLDNVVYQVLNTDGQGAALFLAGPTFVQVNKDEVAIGQIYDPATKTFSNQQ